MLRQINGNFPIMPKPEITCIYSRSVEEGTTLTFTTEDIKCPVESFQIGITLPNICCIRGRNKQLALFLLLSTYCSTVLPVTRDSRNQTGTLDL